MKTTSVFAALLLLACARDSRPTTSPSTAQSPPPASGDVPDLELPMKRVDGLPISELVDPGAANKQPVKEAIAVLYPTAGSRVSGLVRFIDVGGRGVRVTTRVDGLPQGAHAYHVHVFGDCSAPDAKSAGPHFHFTGSSFDPEAKIVTGNLGELAPQTAGMATHSARIENASLQGEFSIIGRAVVVHERGNDPSVTPDGGAGARIACGVIGVANQREARSAMH